MMPDTTIRPAADADEAPLFSAPYAPADEAIAAGLLRDASRTAEAERRVDAYARHLVEGIRARAGGLGGIEDFLHAYSLSTKEGLALMVLAEALLRVPDAATADRLIEDKLATGHWSSHHVKSSALLVSASAWTLGITARILGLDRYAYSALGLDYTRLLMFAALMGFGGAFISLLISKPMAKWTAGVHVIDGTEGADQAFDSMGTPMGPVTSRLVARNRVNTATLHLLARVEVQPDEMLELFEPVPGAILVRGSDMKEESPCPNPSPVRSARSCRSCVFPPSPPMR